MKEAKYRGVRFDVEELEDEPGAARNIIHEYPGRPFADAESAGNHTRRFSFEAHLVGPGMPALITDLEIALSEPGVGVLEHPRYGKVNVVVESRSPIRTSTREIGIARFSVSFVEVGPRKAPELSHDTGLALLASAKSMLDGMRLRRLDLSGFNFIRSAANAVLLGPQSVTANLRRINTRLHQTIGIVDDFSTAIDDFAREVDALLDTPENLAIKLQGLINSVLRAVSTAVPLADAGDRQANASRVGLALQNLSSLGKIGDATPGVQGDTPSRRRQQQNQDDLNEIVEASALAETCALFIDVPLDTPGQANEVLDATSAIFDRLLERGNLEDDLAQRLRTLRGDFYAHLRRAAVDLEDMDTFTPATTVPALLLAWDLYADATRAPEIVNRNGVEHPGFVQGGVPLAVTGA